MGGAGGRILEGRRRVGREIIGGATVDIEPVARAEREEAVWMEVDAVATAGAEGVNFRTTVLRSAFGFPSPKPNSAAVVVVDFCATPSQGNEFPSTRKWKKRERKLTTDSQATPPPPLPLAHSSTNPPSPRLPHFLLSPLLLPLLLQIPILLHRSRFQIRHRSCSPRFDGRPKRDARRSRGGSGPAVFSECGDKFRG